MCVYARARKCKRAHQSDADTPARAILLELWGGFEVAPKGKRVRAIITLLFGWCYYHYQQSKQVSSLSSTQIQTQTNEYTDSNRSIKQPVWVWSCSVNASLKLHTSERASELSLVLPLLARAHVPNSKCSECSSERERDQNIVCKLTPIRFDWDKKKNPIKKKINLDTPNRQ